MVAESEQKVLPNRIDILTDAYLLSDILSDNLPETVCSFHLYHRLGCLLLLHLLLPSHHIRHFRPRHTLHLHDPALLHHAPDVLHRRTLRHLHARLLETHPCNRLHLQLPTRQGPRQPCLRYCPHRPFPGTHCLIQFFPLAIENIDAFFQMSQEQFTSSPFNILNLLF